MSIAESIESINTLAGNVSGLKGNERQDLLQACEKLRDKLEKPSDTIVRLAFSGHQLVVLRLAADLKLFDVMALEAGQSLDGSVNLHALAEKTPAEPLLLTRIMRFLAAMGAVHEIRPQVYSPAPLAADLVSSSPLSAALIHCTHFMSVLSKLPEYFNEKGWKSPHDAHDGPFQFALGSSQHYFEFLSSNPYYGQAFNTVMAMPFRRRGKNWFEFYPAAERLLVSSAGEDLRMFHERFPDLPGKLVLQDLAPVIDSATALPERIESQSYDFFQEQPIKHAKAYFMRTVLHDWPDQQAEKILRRVCDAMGPNSVLLINELILPEAGVLLSSALGDIQMMGSFASLERTEAQWKQLLQNAGLELVHVWLPQDCEKTPEALANQAAVFEARRRYG
ncbi:hypothetical protein N7468_002852 [Penicillium chermesinum]|uniref:O-methyltransferase domain-containing protein n=1 Tax=Penicillium chermesinum TaxID=63820 RepID=A0A9W9U001_9EURO|nr:uncharacterized protein N7468_002852 [Penicillium chermesinum]KAJ5247869.1 hypothetical protein N7468_002852 [Penicillium chermesinum]